MKQHIWKRSDIVTRIDDRGVAHDPMRCTGCGIKGLGIGIPRRTSRHRKWRDKRFEDCELTEYYLEHNKFPPRKKSKKIKHTLDDILEFLRNTVHERDENYGYENEIDWGVEVISFNTYTRPFEAKPVEIYKGEFYFFENKDVEIGFYQLVVINDPKSPRPYPIGWKQYRKRDMIHNDFGENSIRTTESTERAFITAFWNKSGLSDKFTEWMKTRKEKRVLEHADSNTQ